MIMFLLIIDIFISLILAFKIAENYNVIGQVKKDWQLTETLRDRIVNGRTRTIYNLAIFILVLNVFSGLVIAAMA